VDVRPPPGTDPVVAGWLELGRIEANAAMSPAGAGAQLQAWRQRYPAHPANRSLWKEMYARLSRGVAPGNHIALLLPLSGRASSAGTAVQDGFLSAYYEQPQGTRPEVRLYDVGESDAPSAYLAAIADGAQVVVGPLTRGEVANLAAMADGSVTTLALNYLQDGTQTPARFYQFALSPEDEARQAARRAVAEGYVSGVALVPANEWGQRVLAAFNQGLTEAGGTLAAQSYYAPGTTDFSALLGELLQLRPSRTPEGRATKVYRADAQFIFVAAQPVTGRLVRTQLRFNYASRLPVYATSDIYEPGAAGNIDLNGVVFPDMPWVLDEGGPVALLRQAAELNWPDQAVARSRLHAFGYDAYMIVAELTRRQAPFGTPLNGLTGRLTLDAQRQVHRELGFGRIEDGKAVPLPPPGTPLALP
jgi:outer membrane PBP1 activator LpoA protein